ncbi:phosphatidylinositol mannoside acyltransferase [Candidatus Poriferisodalis sp.]|uniref:phosphatidylinositol mannoside acyltransferase n=1 Tax=Candidatus Poriferisodalis sp. TaxID=3101277 RepID=UPI003C6F5750
MSAVLRRLQGRDKARRLQGRDKARRLQGRDKAIVLGYQAGATAARMVPLWLGERLAALAGPVLARLMPAKADMVRRHQARAQRWIASGAGAGGSERDAGEAGADAMAAKRAVQQATAGAFSSYARYWLESFRLPALSESTLDRGIDVPAYHHVEEALERGNGVILALPHLGGWEWAGFWMATVNRLPISVVVEPLHPPELFEWFANFRERLGMRVVPLGPDAGREVLGALRRNEIVCLLCDRDLTSDGIEVSFGDEQTTLPAGPALLALRSGAALLPTAVYFRPRGRHLGTVRPPVDVTRRGRLRDDVATVTQRLADELVTLIAAEPHQWHLFGPNWPSDRPAVSGDAADGD